MNHLTDVRQVFRTPRLDDTEPGGPWVHQRGRRARRPAPTVCGLPAAVLFDRDGTLIEDVPYNGDPRRVRPRPGAVAALRRLHGRGVPVGVVTNQSGVARGLLTRREVEDVHRRVEDILGPFDVWAVCPHGPEDGCGCRKPAPGLVLTAAHRLDAALCGVAVIGDIGADMDAAHAAGAVGILVPTPKTRTAEIAAAPFVADDVLAAVRLLVPDSEPRPGDGPFPASEALSPARDSL